VNRALFAPPVQSKCHHKTTAFPTCSVRVMPSGKESQDSSPGRGCLFAGSGGFHSTPFASDRRDKYSSGSLRSGPTRFNKDEAVALLREGFPRAGFRLARISHAASSRDVARNCSRSRSESKRSEDAEQGDGAKQSQHGRNEVKTTGVSLLAGQPAGRRRRKHAAEAVPAERFPPSGSRRAVPAERFPPSGMRNAV